VNLEHVKLNYADDARAVHVLLRVTDGDGNTDEVLIDNLTTAIAVVVAYGLPITQEVVGFAEWRDAPEWARQWRQASSGSESEALIIECSGDPAIIGSLSW
jgi:hypothetical protein